MDDERARFLIVQLRQLGDIILTTSMIRYIGALYPNAQIDFLSHGMGKLVLKHHQGLVRHLVYPHDSNPISYLRFFSQLREFRYTAVFDFMNNPRSAFLTRVAKANHRVGFAGARAWAYSLSVAKPTGPEYIVDTKKRLVDAYFHASKASLPNGGDASKLGLDLVYQDKDLGVGQRFFAGKDPERIVVILSPTHRREVRQWLPERFAEIADWLVTEWKADVYWAWGPGEEAFAKSIQAMCKENTELMPETSFHELAGFFSHCDLFVGTSNGPSHVAVSAGCPSLQLHGHTDAASWCPNTKLHRSIQSPEYGSANPTLRGISSDQVKQSLLEFLPLIEQRRERFSKGRFVGSWQPSQFE